MQEEFDLHELAVEDARHGHQRPKIEEYGDSLFVVLHTVEFTPTDEIKVGEVDIFVGRNYVLSVRSRTERGFQEVRARAEREPELLQHGSGYVLYALMDAVVDRYFPVLDAIESELERIEEELFQAGTSAAREHRGALLREAEAHHAQARLRPRCWSTPASCSAGACRSRATGSPSTSATSTTTWCASTSRSTRRARR